MYKIDKLKKWRNWSVNELDRYIRLDNWVKGFWIVWFKSRYTAIRNEKS